jgi:ribosomal protein S3AE
MAQEKADKQLVKRKKFIDVEVPITRSKIELIANSPKELENKTVKLDMTRQLKGKSVELVVKIKLENEKPIAYPDKIKLMPYFIRRMIRKRISYVEDSFVTKSQESVLLIKPFLITKRRVSRRIRKTLRNKAKNFIEDYLAQKGNDEIFSEILSNKMQRSLSLVMKKTYPLSLCEIRVLEIIRPLAPEEVPKIKPKEKTEAKKKNEEAEEFIDQMKEIEDERLKKAEEEIKETQKKASKLESSEEKVEAKEEKPKEKKTRVKKEKVEKKE